MKIGDLVRIKHPKLYARGRNYKWSKDIYYSIGIVAECSDDHNAVKVVYLKQGCKYYLMLKDRLEVISD